MKKRIVYSLSAGVGDNEILREKTVECDETVLDQTIEIVLKEAFEGKYRVEDAEIDPAPSTPEERIAELEEALEMLLSGVTE